MTREERRALLGDDVVDEIHDQVDASIAAYGIPQDLLLQLRRTFAPALARLQAQAAEHAGLPLAA